MDYFALKVAISEKDKYNILFLDVHLCTFEGDLRVRVIKALSFCVFQSVRISNEAIKTRYLIFSSIYSIVSEYVDDTR